jgi:hypothetical protein
MVTQYINNLELLNLLKKLVPTRNKCPIFWKKIQAHF